jgi:hypothetical protein
MKGVDLYTRVRRAVYVEGMSQRGAARYFGIDPRTVAKMMRFSVPPGYRRRRPPARPKLDRFTGIIDQILDDDASVPAKPHALQRQLGQQLASRLAHVRAQPRHLALLSTSRPAHLAPNYGRFVLAASRNTA